MGRFHGNGILMCWGEGLVAKFSWIFGNGILRDIYFVLDRGGNEVLGSGWIN